ncbi:MAG: hypothetical protein WD184_05340 [Acidimicrobiia bacterium]
MVSGEGQRVIDTVITRQRDWAAGRALDPSGTRFLHPEDALQVELDPTTRAEFAAGAGGELDRLTSLRSSSCLAINVFSPWRGSPGPVLDALGWNVSQAPLQFEARQPTGLGGVAPHLDVLASGTGKALGIECKFLELYAEARNTFRPSYFDRDGLWRGLPRAEALARSIAEGLVRFRWLAAGQLVKHALGLSKNQPDGFALRLVWYRVEGPIADALETEIADFGRAVGEELSFEAITYQRLISALRQYAEPIPGYFDYLAARYGLDGR